MTEIIWTIPALVAAYFCGYILGMRKADSSWCDYLKLRRKL